MTSTIGVKKIQYPNGTDILTLDSSGTLAIGGNITSNITTTGTVNTPSINGSQIGGRRNIVINGAMTVAQRGDGTTGIGASTGYFTVDRFVLNVGNTAGRLTMSQETITDLSGFGNAVKLNCTTADTSIASNERLLFVQRFEGQDLQQIKKGTSDAEKVTVSFYVKGNGNATYTLELADEDNSRFVAQEFSVTSSWTRVTKTFVADTTGKFDNDNAHSMSLNIWLHAGSDFTGGTFASNIVHTTANQRVGDNQTSFFDSTDRTFFITGIQLEVGAQATAFEHRSFGEELSLCERYFERWNSSGSNESLISVGFVLNSGRVLANYKYNTPKRVDPTGTNSGASGFSCLRGTWVTATSFVILGNKHTARIDFSGLNGFTSNDAAEVRAEAGAGKWFAFDAEL